MSISQCHSKLFPCWHISSTRVSWWFQVITFFFLSYFPLFFHFSCSGFSFLCVIYLYTNLFVVVNILILSPDIPAHMMTQLTTTPCPIQQLRGLPDSQEVGEFTTSPIGAEHTDNLQDSAPYTGIPPDLIVSARSSSLPISKDALFNIVSLLIHRDVPVAGAQSLSSPQSIDAILPRLQSFQQSQQRSILPAPQPIPSPVLDSLLVHTKSSPWNACPQQCPPVQDSASDLRDWYGAPESECTSKFLKDEYTGPDTVDIMYICVTMGVLQRRPCSVPTEVHREIYTEVQNLDVQRLCDSDAVLQAAQRTPHTKVFLLCRDDGAMFAGGTEVVYKWRCCCEYAKLHWYYKLLNSLFHRSLIFAIKGRVCFPIMLRWKISKWISSYVKAAHFKREANLDI